MAGGIYSMFDDNVDSDQAVIVGALAGLGVFGLTRVPELKLGSSPISGPPNFVLDDPVFQVSPIARNLLEGKIILGKMYLVETIYDPIVWPMPSSFLHGNGIQPVNIEFDILSMGAGRVVKGAGVGANTIKNTIKNAIKEGVNKKIKREVSEEVVKTSGWVKRSVFNSLDPVIQKKVAAAIEKGIVAPTGRQGIIKLTATEAAQTGYQYKIKILGKGGDIRIYGNPLENGHIFFDKIMGH